MPKFSTAYMLESPHDWNARLKLGFSGNFSSQSVASDGIISNVATLMRNVKRKFAFAGNSTKNSGRCTVS